MKKILAVLTCLAMIGALSIGVTGCDNKPKTPTPAPKTTTEPPKTTTTDAPKTTTDMKKTTT